LEAQPTPVAPASPRAMDAGRDLFWEELSAEQRDAVTLLGWNPRSWDEGDPEPMESKFWAGVHQPSDGSWRLLTTEERQAAEMLGHTRETWDHGLSADEAAACIQFRARFVQHCHDGTARPRHNVHSRLLVRCIV
jgi:hypothetical protein